MKETAQTRWTKQARRNRLHSIAAMLLVATAQAIAQSKPDAVAVSGSPAGRRIIISVPDRKLALIDGGRVLGVYPVAVGAKVSPSPSGEFQIISRITNPTYYHPGVIIPAGKDNPLGTWMGLNRKGYGIHGTNQPRSIGHAASHGCIRMAKADLEELFAQVRVGDVVEIRTEPDPETAAIFEPGTASTQNATAAGGAGINSATSGQM